MARSVLVVEDDHNIADLLRMYLEKEGFSVRIAPDGGTALQEFAKAAPDLILLDVPAEELTDVDTPQALEAQPRAGSLPRTGNYAHSQGGNFRQNQRPQHGC